MKQEAHTDVSGRCQRSLQTVVTTPESSTVIALHMLSLVCNIVQNLTEIYQMYV